jgi:hypothetical protein
MALKLVVRLLWWLTDPWVGWRYGRGRRRHIGTRLYFFRQFVNRLYWRDSRAAGLGGRFGSWVNRGRAALTNLDANEV